MGLQLGLQLGFGCSGPAGACCWPVGAVLAAGLLDVDDRDDPLAPLDADACRWASTSAFTQNRAVHECASASKRVCSRVNASMCASMVEELTPARVLLHEGACWGCLLLVARCRVSCRDVSCRDLLVASSVTGCRGHGSCRGLLLGEQPGLNRCRGHLPGARMCVGGARAVRPVDAAHRRRAMGLRNVRLHGVDVRPEERVARRA